MTYKKTNHYTWIQRNGNQNAKEHKPPYPSSLQVDPQPKANHRRRRNEEQIQRYQKFCKAVFKEKSFLTKKEFNYKIQLEFKGNSSYYRKRMIQLGFIEERKNVLRPHQL